MSLADDPRWRRFNDRDFRCPCCGRSFQGIFDIAFDHPDPWPHGHRGNSGEEEIVVGADRLGTDLCELEGNYFIRCILPLNLQGSDEAFAFGVWVSASEANFRKYAECWAARDYSGFPGWAGWVMNDLPGFELTGWLACDAYIPGDAGKRPEAWVREGEHEIARMQDEGITFDQLLDIYAAAGQDIRPHLIDG